MTGRMYLNHCGSTYLTAGRYYKTVFTFSFFIDYQLFKTMHRFVTSTTNSAKTIDFEKENPNYSDIKHSLKAALTVFSIINLLKSEVDK